MMQALAQYGPYAINAITNAAPGVADTAASIDVKNAPIYNELYNQGQMAGANTEAAVAEGPGQRLVTAADKYQRQVDPEAYQSRALVSQALDKYIGGYDPNKLSAGETEQISRGIGATDGSLTPSNLNTIKNAQTFGSAATDRWKNFGNAISQAAAALPALKSGINAFNVATQRGTPTNPNLGQFAVGQNMGFANSALGNIAANQRQAIAKQKDTMDLVLGGTQAFGNVIGGL